MNKVDLDRVTEARKRLHAADDRLDRGDPAIRMVELASPRAGERPLELHRAFCVVNGLGESARHAIAATVDALRTDNPNIGLAGVVESLGRRQPLHGHRRPSGTPGTSLVPTAAIYNRSTPHTAQTAALAEVIDTIDRAVLLSSAELRGADAVAEELDRELQSFRPEHPPASSAIEPTTSREQEVLDALDRVAPSQESVDLVAACLEALENDAERTRRQAACSQAAAAKSQVLPSDANDVTLLADLAVAEAEGALAEYDMTPGSPAHQLADSLANLGLKSPPFQAREMAIRVIEETIELNEMRARLTRSIERTVESPEMIRLRDERRRVDAQRFHIQRRLRSQQQSLAIAREQWSHVAGGLTSIPPRPDDGERPLPVLVEEPLADLPARLSGSILSMLLRHSLTTQVICVSDQLDLRSWCNTVGDRAGWVAASGWFTGRN